MRLTFRPSLRRAAPWIATVLAAACSQDGLPTSPFGPGEEPAANLNVVVAAPTAAPPDLAAVSFYARQGRRSEGRVYLTDQPGVGRGHEYLRLTIPRDGLLARPDGTPIATGDSVLITIRLLDPSRILFQMEPGGLRFNPASPAELRIRYEVADGDLNHDGLRDAQDDSVETHLGIWRQADPQSVFVRLESVVWRNNREVRASLPGFSRYAIAY